MKNCLIGFVVFITSISVASAQTSYRATFEGIITTDELLKEFDSIRIAGGKSPSEKVPVSKLPVSEMPVMKLAVDVKGSRVVVKRLDENNIQSISSLGPPDSSIFENDAWYTYRQGKAELKSPFKDKLSKTGEKRIIYGYECVRYLWESTETIRVTELWVAPDMPPGISPFTVKIPVKGAILESRQMDSGFTYRLILLQNE